MPVEFLCLHFDHLDRSQLYEIMALRQRVFIVEQNCPYLDADGKDQQSWHLLGKDSSKGQLVAYARLLPEGVSYASYASIGRIVTAPEVRRTGIGHQLMRKALERIPDLFGALPLKISAQEYLKVFYESYNFQKRGDAYLEDGIPHIAMVRPG